MSAKPGLGRKGKAGRKPLVSGNRETIEESDDRETVEGRTGTMIAGLAIKGTEVMGKIDQADFIRYAAFLNYALNKTWTPFFSLEPFVVISL